MKRCISILLVLLLLLAGCKEETLRSAEPTPSPSPEGTVSPAPTPEPALSPAVRTLELDVGDGEHTFWVELTEQEEDVGGVWVNVYCNKGDTEPFQRFEDHTCNFDRANLIVEDVDFDGNMDFHFESSWGSLPIFWHTYYVWDAGEEKFVPDPYGLNELPDAEFNPYAQEVSSGTRVQEYYQYEDGELVLVGEVFRPEEDGTGKAYKAEYITVDDAHTFWVEYIETEGFGSFEVNIYQERKSSQPIQTLAGSCENSFESLYLAVEDVDFDGYADFAILYGDAPNGHAGFSYYIWEEKEEKFIPDPYGLNELHSVGFPEFLPEEKTVRTFLRWGAGSEGEARSYRYLEEGFTCVRKMYWCWHENDSVDFLVEDYENGEMRAVYEETCSSESLGGYLWSEEFSNWYDLDHHGKQ